MWAHIVAARVSVVRHGEEDHVFLGVRHVGVS